MACAHIFARLTRLKLRPSRAFPQHCQLFDSLASSGSQLHTTCNDKKKKLAHCVVAICVWLAFCAFLSVFFFAFDPALAMLWLLQLLLLVFSLFFIKKVQWSADPMHGWYCTSVCVCVWRYKCNNCQQVIHALIYIVYMYVVVGVNQLANNMNWHCSLCGNLTLSVAA